MRCRSMRWKIPFKTLQQETLTNTKPTRKKCNGKFQHPSEQKELEQFDTKMHASEL